MSNLVDQLRLCASSPKTANYELLVDAAARIEALEAALREIAGQKLMSELEAEHYFADAAYGYDAVVMIARAALDKDAGK